MAEVASKTVGNRGNVKYANVTLADGRTGTGTSGGFFDGTEHEAVTKATQNANSKPTRSRGVREHTFLRLHVVAIGWRAPRFRARVFYPHYLVKRHVFRRKTLFQMC